MAAFFVGSGLGGWGGRLFYFAGIKRGREESGNRTESLRLSDRQRQIMRANICRAPGISAFVAQDTGRVAAGRNQYKVQFLSLVDVIFAVMTRKRRRDGPATGDHIMSANSANCPAQISLHICTELGESVGHGLRELTGPRPEGVGTRVLLFL